MIEGFVDAALEARVTVAVSGTAERSSRVDALIDTGYSGHITLPPAVVNDLGLVRVGRTKLEFANGDKERVGTYLASVDWSGAERLIVVHEIESEPLVGMQLLEDHRLQVDVESGGRVLIESLTG